MTIEGGCDNNKRQRVGGGEDQWLGRGDDQQQNDSQKEAKINNKRWWLGRCDNQ